MDVFVVDDVAVGVSGGCAGLVYGRHVGSMNACRCDKDIRTAG